MHSLALASPAERLKNGSARDSLPVDVEGVEPNKQKARVKPGYQFQRESSKSVAIFKTSNIARFQTGTITCTSQSSKTCEVFISKDHVQCSGGCFFVGVRGAVRGQ